MVADPIDLIIGGEGGKDPVEKAKLLRDRDLPVRERSNNETEK